MEGIASVSDRFQPLRPEIGSGPPRRGRYSRHVVGYTTHVTLLQRLSAGRESDPGSWGDFCDRYGELIRGYARRRGLQPADCDDVVQDVLLALTKSLPGFTYDPAKGRFRAYLHAMVNHAIHRRSFQKRGERPLEDGAASFISDGVDADEPWEVEWRQHHLRVAMRSIEAEFNANDLAAFESYAIEGRGVRDVSAELGLTADQIYQAKSRILRRVAELIRAQVEDEG